ncbi:MAG: hypothetical protein AAF502_13410 [Bacteroidota bacterium]
MTTLSPCGNSLPVPNATFNRHPEPYTKIINQNPKYYEKND